MLKDKYLWLTLGLSIFAVAPLFYPGYFQTHSGFIPLWSVADLKENIFNFAWRPVLIPFDPWRSGGLLPYYLAALLPLPALTAVKAVSFIGILAGSSGLYLWLKSWIGAQGASIAALVYTYAPFTITALYVRGAWSEAFFWGALPWALLAATFLVGTQQRKAAIRRMKAEGRRRKAKSSPFILPPSFFRFHPSAFILLIAAGFWTALGLSHLSLSVWAYLFMLAMLLGFHRPQALMPLLAGAGGLLLATLLTLPKASGAINVNLTDHLVYPAQLISPFWGFGVSQSGWNDGLSLSLGLAAIGLSILTFSIWRGGPDKRPWFFVSVAVFASLAVMPIGGWLWKLSGFNRLLAYPWQLLGFAALSLAVFSGVGLWLNERLRQFPLYAALLILPILAIYPHLEPQYIAAPIPEQPEAIYGDQQILLIEHQFIVDNPAANLEADPEAELKTNLRLVEPYLSLADAAPLAPGDTFYLQVTWQAVTQPKLNYKIFAHLVDAEGTLIAQVDTQPQQGARPTATWLPGELITDRYAFTLPAGAPPPAQVWLGFYNEDTLKRLPVNGDDEGRAMLDVQ